MPDLRPGILSSTSSKEVCFMRKYAKPSSKKVTHGTVVSMAC
ncbi:hypothetical protein ABZ478_02920 [Streptomyces sp. NPDC005706]